MSCLDAPENGTAHNLPLSHPMPSRANWTKTRFALRFWPEYDFAAMTAEIRLYLSFALIKLIGYTLFCVFLARYYQKPFLRGVAAGSVRTLIGMATGALLFYGIFYPGHFAALTPAVRVSLLAPVRLVEWWVVFWLFFGRPFQRSVVLPILGAIVWSFVLDILGLFLLSGLIRGIIC
jgi:hypothetical protein